MKLRMLAVLLTFSLFALPSPIWAQEPAKNAAGTSLTNMRTLNGQSVLSLLRTKDQPFEVEAPSKDEKRQFLLHMSKGYLHDYITSCNGGTDMRATVPDFSADGRSNSCEHLADGYEAAGNEVKQFEALLLGCWWDRTELSGGFGGTSCRDLGAKLFTVKNTDAAKAIFEHAEGCHGRNRAGDPINLCFSTALRYKDAFPFEEFRVMAQEAYSREGDLAAASYLQTVGESVDMQSALQTNNDKSERAHQANMERIHQEEAASEERRADARERTNALRELNDQVSQGGTAILNTGNEQVAAIRAIGDVNAATQHQAEQQRQSAQKAQQAVPQTSSSPQPRTYRAMTQCVKVVSATYHSNGSVGSQDDIRVVVTNTCAETIFVAVSHYRYRDTCTDGEAQNLAPGASFTHDAETGRNWYGVVANNNIDWGVTGQGPALQIPNSCLDKYPVK